MSNLDMPGALCRKPFARRSTVNFPVLLDAWPVGAPPAGWRAGHLHRRSADAGFADTPGIRELRDALPGTGRRCVMKERYSPCIREGAQTAR